MNTAVLRAFEERFYEWAFGDFQREIDSDFPFLRRIADYDTSRAIVAIMKALPSERRYRLASTLVRAKRVLITTPPHIDYSPDDEAILAWYFERIRQPTAYALEANFKESIGETSYRINKDRLMHAIAQRLADGFPQPNVEDGALCYEVTKHGFRVNTIIERGTNRRQLSYHHRIRNEQHGVDVKWICIYSWFGIASQVYWTRITEPEIDSTAQLVRELCVHFLNAADDLLEGLVTT